jgi:Na+/phosphate symporter
MAVLLLLLCLGLLIFAATRSDWALLGLVVLVLGAMSFGVWIMHQTQGWDGL